MKSLYLRIWLTVVAALALFALVSGWMWHRHLDEERVRYEAVANERLQAWAELVHRSLPAADARAVYDPGRDITVLVHPNGETWEWDDYQWRHVPTPGAPVWVSPAMEVRPGIGGGVRAFQSTDRKSVV